MNKQTTIMITKENHEWLNKLKHDLYCNSFNELFEKLKKVKWDELEKYY